MGDGKSYLQKTINALKGTSAPRSDVHEIETLLAAFEKYRSSGKTLLYTGSLTVSPVSTLNAISEIDGAMLCFSKQGNLRRIVLVEAKDLQSGSKTQAIKALKQKIQKISKPNEIDKWAIETVDGGAVAFLQN